MQGKGGNYNTSTSYDYVKFVMTLDLSCSLTLDEFERPLHPRSLSLVYCQSGASFEKSPNAAGIVNHAKLLGFLDSVEVFHI